MASGLNSKRVFLMMIASFGLIAAVICGALLALGVREPTRELLFLVGSLVVVSIVCLVLAFAFKGTATRLEDEMKQADYQRAQKRAIDQDQAPLPQNAPSAQKRTASVDPDDVQLPQNAVPARPSKATPDPDDVQLPQNAVPAQTAAAAPDPDDVQLPQNAPGGGVR